MRQKMKSEKKKYDEQIYTWVARASAPMERLFCDAFSPLEEQEEIIIQDRLKSWRTVFENSEFGVEEILSKRGLSEKQWQQSVLDVEVVDAQALPTWAKHFYRLMTLWYTQNNTKDTPTLPETETFNNRLFGYNWAMLAISALDEQIKILASEHRIHLSKKTISGLLAYFIYRLYSPILGVMSSSTRSYGQQKLEPEKYNSLEFWRNSFDKQPVLVSIIGHIYDDWLTATQEMLQRLQTDIVLIKQYFFTTAGTEKIMVENIECGLGDPHRGGRSVAIITTNLGEVVYKPKNLIGTEAIGILLEKLNSASPQYVPLTPKFINRGDYGWEEKVSPKQCQSKDDIKIYYQRLGAWLRLLQILNANDFWYDNLIASGNMPYFIDYETIIGVPRNSQYHDTLHVLSYLGILPMFMHTYTLTDDAIDMGCTSKPGAQKTPLKSSFSDEDKRSLELEATDFAVYFEDKFVDINDYFKDFQQGFRVMNQLLLSPDGKQVMTEFFNNAKNARFRHIFIDTWGAYYAISQFNKTTYADGIRHAISFDRAFTAFKGYPYLIVESAINSMKFNDVPIYEIQADNCNAYTIEKEILSDYTQKSPIDYAKDNLAKLHQVEQDLAIVRTLYSLRADNPAYPYLQNSDKINDYQPLAIATDIGDYLLSLIDKTQKNLNMVSRTLEPALLRQYVLQPLSLNLDGAVALIILFARLYRKHHDQKYYQALQQLYHYITNEQVGSDKSYGYSYGYNYGLVSESVAKLLACDELSMWFDTKSLIKQCYQAILSRLKETPQIVNDYGLGISGLLSVMAVMQSHTMCRDYHRQIIDEFQQKELVKVQKSPILERHCQQLFVSQYWGVQLSNHYWQATPNYQPLKSSKADGRELSYADLNAAIFLKALSKDEVRKQIQLKTAKPSGSQSTLDLLYNCLYFKKYYQEEVADIKNLSLSLINYFRANNHWFYDTWADDCCCLSAHYGLVDIALLFLAQDNINDMVNPARLIEK